MWASSFAPFGGLAGTPASGSSSTFWCARIAHPRASPPQGPSFCLRASSDLLHDQLLRRLAVLSSCSHWLSSPVNNSSGSTPASPTSPSHIGIRFDGPRRFRFGGRRRFSPTLAVPANGSGSPLPIQGCLLHPPQRSAAHVAADRTLATSYLRPHPPTSSEAPAALCPPTIGPPLTLCPPHQNPSALAACAQADISRPNSLHTVPQGRPSCCLGKICLLQSTNSHFSGASHTPKALTGHSVPSTARRRHTLWVLANGVGWRGQSSFCPHLSTRPPSLCTTLVSKSTAPHVVPCLGGLF